MPLAYFFLRPIYVQEYLFVFVFFEEGIDLLGSLLAAGHSADDEGGAVEGVAADEDVRGVGGVVGLEEAHGEEAELGLDDFGLALLNHDGTSAGGVGFPVDFLDADAGEVAVGAEELEGVDVPAAGAAFFVAARRFEGARPGGPGVLGVVGAFDGAGLDFDLGDGAGALAVGGTDAVRTSITTTNHKYVLALGCYALIFRELHASQHTILLRQHLEGDGHP